MLVCRHDTAPYGAPMCCHLFQHSESPIGYVRWYTGVHLDSELLCTACADQRETGSSVPSKYVCDQCFRDITLEEGFLKSTRGQPGVSVRAEAFEGSVKEFTLSKEFGRVIDVAPIERDSRSVWLLLTEDGQLAQVDCGSGDWSNVARSSVAPEPDQRPWCGHQITSTLHCSRGGEFAAVVNDYGKYGQVIDLRSGKVTMELNSQSYHCETVPFSFAFAGQHQIVVIHRTAWNRLDISDPATGKLLSERGPISYRSGEPRPEHYRDYFHGALHVSPGSTQILDDGWVWAPVGMPTIWSLERWGSKNVWESEDGPTRHTLTQRSYYWTGPACWVDEHRVVIGKIGDDDTNMIDGARIFDITLLDRVPGQLGTYVLEPGEVYAFPGPAGKFFSDGASLFSSDQTGLSRWDPTDGMRTGHLENFSPTHYHRGARELAQLTERSLLRLKIR
jgi:hypothetical protein